MFAARESPVHNLGLFSTQAIERGSIFPLQTSRPRAQAWSYANRAYVLEYYTSPDTRLDTNCVVDGKVVSLARIVHTIGSAARQERYVTCSDLFMTANDLAWPAAHVRDYDRQSDANALEFILEYSTTVPRHVVGVWVHVLHDIPAHTECGVTYGFDFWKA